MAGSWSQKGKMPGSGHQCEAGSPGGRRIPGSGPAYNLLSSSEGHQGEVGETSRVISRPYSRTGQTPSP